VIENSTALHTLPLSPQVAFSQWLAAQTATAASVSLAAWFSQSASGYLNFTSNRQQPNYLTDLTGPRIPRFATQQAQPVLESPKLTIRNNIESICEWVKKSWHIFLNNWDVFSAIHLPLPSMNIPVQRVFVRTFNFDPARSCNRMTLKMPEALPSWQRR